VKHLVKNSDTILPIFYDPAGHRWPRLRRAWLAVAILVTMLIATLVASVLVNPVLPQFDLLPLSSLPHAVETKTQTPAFPETPRGQKRKLAGALLNRNLAQTGGDHAAPIQTVVTAKNVEKPIAIGFYVNWDDSSYESLKLNLGQLDWLVPEWGRLQDGAGAGSDPLARDIDSRVIDLLRQERPGMPIVPLVQNYRNERWDPALLERAVADETSRARLVEALVRFVNENRFAGVCIDFEEAPAASQANLLLFMQNLHAAFSSRGWILAQAVPFDNPEWNLRDYAAATDYLLLMAYDQHWSTSAAGPIVAQDWFERNLALRMSELEPAKTIICFGNYGYNWTQGNETTEVTFQEAVLAARDSEAHVSFDPVSRNPFFSYEEEDGADHTVWFLDAVTAYNQIRTTRKFHLAGYALWRLGSEDPSLWGIFGSGRMDNSPESLQQIRFGYDVDFESTGEILEVSAQPQEGFRKFKIDSITGFIDQEDYTRIPSSYVIRRSGDQPGLVALTFDDGPDPLWTPRILEILKEENVPATFFIIGANGQASPNLVRRIVDEGHDIGNHTYSHPNLGEVPGRVTDLELNATQRLIESLTGRATILFRPPYFGDAEPTTPDEVDPIVRAMRLGYLTIGLRVDPDDWALPGTNEIVQRTINGITATDPDQRGQIVLLHDGGGYRQQTLDALPQIIHELRARKFRFVTVSQLAGLKRDQAMPAVPAGQELFTRSNAITFSALSLGERLLHWIFVVGILLGLARITFIGALAFAQWRRSRGREVTHAGETYQPFVSVIVPAYNEELVIEKTIASLLASTYPSFEIIVVDDGSSDGTSEVVRNRFSVDQRVRLFTIVNGGKAEALNFGLRYARGEIIVALDADTLFAPQTIEALAHRFHDSSVAAVAGNAKVGNRINLLTCLQALEYITSQNLDRRAFASLNCITVVPGAVGAWRRDLVERVGGFSSDTLAEDQDLTLELRRLGYKISYEENAIAWTEAPDTLRALAKQRFRWSFGTLQCLWKHRDALLRPRFGTLGVIAMPNVWIFQILFPLISPVMDLMLVWALFLAALQRMEHPTEYVATNLRQVLFYYAVFLVVDWLAAGFALLLEKRERASLLWWLFLQRFCYRQLMYWVMIKSVTSAARGALIGWGKLERKATAEAQP
jgi:cellulose synthase/poly-beta-1,6-N-acetylglucosamine synthase-like glycosyltransferase/peptidoglycan/xylan/chitin deacetylase (PgdA/CDA1 family)